MHEPHAPHDPGASIGPAEPQTPASDADLAPRWHRAFVMQALRRHLERSAVAAGGVALVFCVATGILSYTGWRSCEDRGSSQVCRVVHIYPFTVQPRAELTFVDGVLSGLRRDWYADGQLWLEGEYLDGKRRGVWREYWPHGALRFEGTYRADVLDGVETWFWPHGGREWEVGRRNGQRDGEERWWHPNGQLRRVGGYAQGVRHGTFAVFRLDGTPAFSGQYVNGALAKGRAVD